MIHCFRLSTLVVGIFVGSLLNCQLSHAETGWKAGAARAVITPESPMWMSGYGSRNKPAEGTLTDLNAKVLVLEDECKRRAVLITLDLVGIDQALTRDICTSLAEKYGLARHQIGICTSHTHTGPAVGKNLAPLHYLQVDQLQQKLIDDYAVKLRANVVAVVGEALEGLVPSQLAWGSGTATFAVNRRNNKEAAVPEDRAAGTLVGPHDHDVPVLTVRDIEGNLTAVVFGYACHSTVLNFYKWSGDYPGFAQIAFEEQHPGCQAMFFAGCGADQNPLPRRTVQLARHYGRRLASAVEAVVLTSKMTPVLGSLKTSYQAIDLPLANLPTREEIAKDTASTNKYVAARARMLLEQLDDGQSLATTYPYPIGVWQIGDDVQFILLGGEVVVDYAVRLKAELKGTRTWVAGYANDVMAYIPSRRVLAEGGYEGGGAMVYYGLPTIWAPELENAIAAEVHRQLQPSSP
mgnify:CR=1 FL=1|jgi:hypothetical protein